MRIDWASFKKKYIPPEPNQFPIGSRVYIGHQGEGKTLSMVDYTFRIKEAFSSCKIFTNVKLRNIPHYRLEDDEGVIRALNYQNGENGVLVLLDEAHLFFNKKGGIPLEVLTAISQQRKDRRRLIFTSQIWNELDISLRKQVEEVVACRKIGRFQLNTVYDGRTVRIDKSDYSYVMDKKYRELFKHNQEFYDRFDTYQKIIRNDEYDRTRTAAAPHNAALQAAVVKGVTR